MVQPRPNEKQRNAGRLVRISGGVLKGKKIGIRKLFTAKNSVAELRPTAAKVREALFDILKNNIAGVSFLDLYAGSGAVGFEALSRGASTICFVESDQQRAKAIQDIIEKAGLADRMSSCREQVIGFLNRAERSGIFFDIIFADPPYASEEITDTVSFIDKSRMLRDGGDLIVEHASKKSLDNSGLVTLHPVKTYRYGDTMLTRYRKVI